MGRPFRVSDITDLEELLPDCGYQLRSVSIEATGVLKAVDCGDCPEGETLILMAHGGGVELELAEDAELVEGPVHLLGTVYPPFADHQRIEVDRIDSL